jgi:DNA-binding Lrp family transcriptional regulator
MPINLRDTDIAVLNALLRDGRMSLRQISRDAGISTPTVKNRFNRLVNLGVIKSISPILDLNKITYTNKNRNNKRQDIADIVARYKRACQQPHDGKKKKLIKVEKGIAVIHNCDHCKNPLTSKMYMLKVAAFERFFCCNECKMAYKKKYAGRMKAISKHFS